MELLLGGVVLGAVLGALGALAVLVGIAAYLTRHPADLPPSRALELAERERANGAGI